MTFIESYSVGEFNFLGGFCFDDDQSEYHYILGENGCSIVIDSALLSALRNKTLDEEFMFKLVQHGLAKTGDSFLPGDEFECLRSGACKPEPSFFLIDITKNCNLNCIYCFRDLKEKGTISIDTLRDVCQFILETVKQYNRKNISIQMWGGEPMLAFDRIEFVYNFFQKTDVQVDIHIETNGTLITDEIAEKLFAMHICVGVSLDGLPDHQNRQRKTVTGADSMPLLEKGIRSLKKYYGSNFGGITVITKYNYKDISKILKYYKADLGINNIKFNIVKDNPNAVERAVGLSITQIEEFAADLCDQLEWYEVLGWPFHETNIEARINQLTERAACSCCISNGCKGGFSLLSIDLHGDIYPCDLTDQKEFKMGSIYSEGKLVSGDSLERQILTSKKMNPFFKEVSLEFCKGCPWKYFCKGGCTTRIRSSDYPSGIDEAECIFNRTVYPRIIKRILRVDPETNLCLGRNIP